jgi:predicted kinase
MSYNLNVEMSQSALDAGRLYATLENLPGPSPAPALIVVSGLPGTGKTYFAHKLAERIPAVILSSDPLRKTLFPSPEYTPEESRRLFRAVHGVIRQLLKRKITVIMDATTLKEELRESLYNIAGRAGARFILIRVKAPAAVVRQRMADRTYNEPGCSDADWNVYRQLKTRVEPMSRRHYVVDTSADIGPALDRIVNRVAGKPASRS